MAAPRRKFDNIDVELPNGETMRVGTHEDKKKKQVTVKLRLPGQWNLTWLARGVKNAKATTLEITEED